MTQLTICLDLLLLFCGNVQSTAISEFQLVTPDTVKIREQLIASDYNEEAIYYYLINNFKSVSELYDTVSFEWDTEAYCSFKKDFEFGIRYTIDECGEGGSNIILTFPKVKRKEMKDWIETIHGIYEFEEDGNVWKNNTMYVPEEEGAGCYYKIRDTATETFVTIYCGC